MPQIAVWDVAAPQGPQDRPAVALPDRGEALPRGTLELCFTLRSPGPATLLSAPAQRLSVALLPDGALACGLAGPDRTPLRVAGAPGLAPAGARIQVTLTWGGTTRFAVLNRDRQARDPDDPAAAFVADLALPLALAPGMSLRFPALEHGAISDLTVTLSDSVDRPGIPLPEARILPFRRPGGSVQASPPRAPSRRGRDGMGRLQIATPGGERPLGDLVPGDCVLTRAGGVAALRRMLVAELSWDRLRRSPAHCPVAIRRGALGPALPCADLVLPPWLRLVDPATGRTRAADTLLDRDGVFEVEAMGATFLHPLFERTETVLLNGAWVEIGHPDDAIDPRSRALLLSLYPEFRATGPVPPAS